MEKKLVISLLTIFIFIITIGTGFAATSVTMNYNMQNDFYYGDGSWGNYSYHLEHWPGYNQTSGGDTRTYIRLSHSYSEDQALAYDTTVNTDVIYPQKLEAASNTPTYISDNWNWIGTKVQRTITMAVGAATGLKVGSEFAPYVEFSEITLSTEGM